MSRTDRPREYNARILSSKPTNRRWRFLTILGSKLPSRSRGASSATLPCSVISVFGVVPFLVFPVPPGGSWCGSNPRWSVSSTSIARSTSRFVNCASSPPGPAISSSLLAPASSSSITSSLIRRSDATPRACRTRRRPETRATASSTSSRRSPPSSPPQLKPPTMLRGGAGISPDGEPPAPSRIWEAPSSENFFLLSVVAIGMRPQFAHAHTDPRTLPGGRRRLVREQKRAALANGGWALQGVVLLAEAFAFDCGVDGCLFRGVEVVVEALVTSGNQAGRERGAQLVRERAFERGAEKLLEGAAPSAVGKF